MTFHDFYTRYNWRPIRNCPGRYTLLKDSINSFNEYYNTLENLIEYPSTTGRDPVLIYQFHDGGLISYRHDDGFLVHTLNDSDGFIRKMKEIGKIPQKNSIIIK